MKQPIILIGVGEMGAVFARGFLRLGYPVYPVTRAMDMSQVAASVTTPEAVLVAVAEKDLKPLLAELPSAWKDRLILLQNELLPADYADFPDATVISVWFEKKKGQDSKVISPSPAHGPRAGLLEQALASIDIPVRRLESDEDMLFELVAKNLYIITTNIAGLVTGGNVGELWRDHRELAEAIANDVINLQQALTGEIFDHEALIQSMVTAFDGDPGHKCMGRSATARLQRAMERADAHQLEVPSLAEIAANMH